MADNDPSEPPKPPGELKPGSAPPALSGTPSERHKPLYHRQSETEKLRGQLGPAFDAPTTPTRARTSINYNENIDRDHNRGGVRRTESAIAGTTAEDKGKHSTTITAAMQRKNRVSKRDQSNGEEVQIWTRTQAMIADIVKNFKEDNDRVNQLVKDDKELGAMSDDKIPFDRLQAMDDRCREGVRESDTLQRDVQSAVEKLELLRAIAVAKEQPDGPPTTLGKRSTAARDRERDRDRDRDRGDRDKDKDSASAAAGSSVYDFDGGGDSPVPSPIGSQRKYSERASNRDRDSMPPKADSAEPRGSSVGPSGSGSGGAAAAAAAAAAANKSKVVFSKGDAVAFKPKAAGGEQTSDWILGEVAQVLGEGKSRRYKVLDVEPDEQATKKEYRSSASSMIPITPERAAGSLPDWEAGKVVLALYPNTTTFYRAEVYSMGEDGRVDLKFEGENDSSTLQQVERRFVIEYRP